MFASALYELNSAVHLFVTCWNEHCDASVGLYIGSARE